MRAKINLITYSDIVQFVQIVSQVTEKVLLTNEGRTFIVSAKSMLGVMYSIEWQEDLYCECERDIYSKIERFLAE